MRAPAGPLQRVVVIGISGAGKSTLARRLAGALDAPRVELDALHWGAGWTPRASFRDDVAAAVQGDRWVVDGNYAAVRDLVWPRATQILWLNLSFPRVVWHVLRRTLHRARTRELLWNGNRESWRRSFLSRDSVLWWVLTMYHRRRRDHEARREATGTAGPRWIELRSPREIDAWLRDVEAAAALPEPVRP